MLVQIEINPSLNRLGCYVPMHDAGNYPKHIWRANVDAKCPNWSGSIVNNSDIAVTIACLLHEHNSYVSMLTPAPTHETIYHTRAQEHGLEQARGEDVLPFPQTAQRLHHLCQHHP